MKSGGCMAPSRSVLVLTIVVAVVSGSTCSSPASPSPDAPRVTVYLNSGGVEQFEYDRFVGYPNTVQEIGNCTSYPFSKETISQILIHGRSVTECSSAERVEWEVTIEGSAGSHRGHYYFLLDAGRTFSVSGRDLNTGQSKSVDYENVSRIVFTR